VSDIDHTVVGKDDSVEEVIKSFNTGDMEQETNGKGMNEEKGEKRKRKEGGPIDIKSYQ